MKRNGLKYIPLFVFWVLVSSGLSAAAGELPLWDNTVNRLLAAGLYGVELSGGHGLSMRLDQTQDVYQRLAADKSILHGQRITFSYEGSSGLLGFSAGIINTVGSDEGYIGSVFLGIDDPMGFRAYDLNKAWYWSLDLSTSYRPHENLVLGLSGKTLLMKDPAGSAQVLSFLLNMPVSYKKYITIIPEVQWSRSLPVQELNSSDFYPPQNQGVAPEDVFYGGVSISISY